MSAYIYEHNGVTLHVDYAVDTDGVVCFEQIRAMGADYSPVGQDLIPLLEQLHVVQENFTKHTLEVESFLSVLVREIQNDRTISASKPN